MANANPHPKFSSGDIVNYRGQSTCVVLSTSNQLGFNVYHLLELDTGYTIRSSAHEIASAVDSNVIDLPDIEVELPVMDDDLVELGEQTAVKKETKPARFKILDDNELDELASKRTEKTTDKQTAWAVKMFKGKYSDAGFVANVYVPCLHAWTAI